MNRKIDDVSIDLIDTLNKFNHLLLFMLDLFPS